MKERGYIGKESTEREWSFEKGSGKGNAQAVRVRNVQGDFGDGEKRTCARIGKKFGFDFSGEGGREEADTRRMGIERFPSKLVFCDEESPVTRSVKINKKKRERTKKDDDDDDGFIEDY